MEKKDLKYLIVIFLFFFVIFHPFLSVYFSGDDFFHFKVSQTDGSVVGFLKLFGFYSFEQRGIAFYRPIFREALYNISHSLFGLNHIPFRLLQTIIHLLNITLVYIFFNKLMSNKFVGFLAAFFFAVSAANVGSLYYLAGGVQAQGALLLALLSMIFFLNKKMASGLIFFILSLMSHELALSVPLILLGINWTKEKSMKEFVVSSIKKLWIYGILIATFLYIVIFVIGTSQSEIQYQPNLNPKVILNTLAWYVVWSIGIPEMLVDYLGNGLKLNPNLMNNWRMYFKYIFPAFFIFVSTILLSLIFSIKNNRLLRDKKFWLLVLWFIIGLTPVLLLPLHKKTYYLQISLPAICGAFAYVLFRQSKLIISISVISFLILSIFSFKLADKTYWAAQRGRVAENLIQDIKSMYPSLPKATTLYIKNDHNYPFISKEWGGTSTQAYFILNGEDALQLLYEDDGLKVKYEDRDEKPVNSIEFIAQMD